MKWTWIAWIVSSLILAGGLACLLVVPGRQTVFLPGETSHGHYQIEMKCEACHTPLMGVKQEACLNCHQEELAEANDAHPISKFTDPRNADRVAILDARRCVICHREHLPEQTRKMGVTLPDDYCFYCHKDIGQERPSHKNLAFKTCATAGCHNYHDNRSLYEDFLLKHAEQPPLSASPLIPQVTQNAHRSEPLKHSEMDAPTEQTENRILVEDWLASAHALAGVNCMECHAESRENPSIWVEKPKAMICRECHAQEAEGFLAGRHGMRLAQDLSPMTPGMARLPMKQESIHVELNCNSCHAAHSYNTQYAAVDACLKCHNDEHSKSFTRTDNKHYRLWLAEAEGGKPGSGVSCAVCHLPKLERSRDGEKKTIAQHNQNDNLRPNEKMIRNVCLHCHGLSFSIDALADPLLIRNNFIGTPSRHIESIEMAVSRNQ